MLFKVEGVSTSQATYEGLAVLLVIVVASFIAVWVAAVGAAVLRNCQTLGRLEPRAGKGTNETHANSTAESRWQHTVGRSLALGERDGGSLRVNRMCSSSCPFASFSLC